VQFAKCCNPIPGIHLGFIKKGQGLVRAHQDCPTAAKSRGDPEKWLDVDWAPETDKLFDVAIASPSPTARRARQGATEIAEAGSNIDNVSMTRSAASTPPCTSRCRSRTAAPRQGDALLEADPGSGEDARVRIRFA